MLAAPAPASRPRNAPRTPSRRPSCGPSRRTARLEHGEHLRAWVLTIAKNVAVDTLRRAKPTDRARRDGRRRQPAGLRGARAADGRAPSEGAGRRRAPVRLRPLLRPDRSRARLERGRRPPGRLDGRAQAARKDGLMTISSRSRPPLPRRRRHARPARRRLRRRSTRRSARCSSPPPIVASPRSRSTPSRRSSSSGSRASPGLASCARRSPSTRPAASSTSTSRAGGRHSTSRSTCARCRRSPSSVLARAREGPVRGDDDVRRARRARRATAGRAGGRHGHEPEPASRSCSRATASSARPETSSATRAGSTRSCRCSGSKARCCRGEDLPRPRPYSSSRYPTPQTLTMKWSVSVIWSFLRNRDACDSSVRVRPRARNPHTSRSSSSFVKTR